MMKSLCVASFCFKLYSNVVKYNIACKCFEDTVLIHVALDHTFAAHSDPTVPQTSAAISVGPGLCAQCHAHTSTADMVTILVLGHAAPIAVELMSFIPLRHS